MTHQGAGIHHLHIRKRIHEKFEKYPHPDAFKRFYDNFIYIVAIFGPFFNLPQAYKILTEKSSAGVSVFSWVAFAIISFLWLIYGIIHKDKHLIILYSTLILTQLIVIVMALIY